MAASPTSWELFDSEAVMAMGYWTPGPSSSPQQRSLDLVPIELDAEDIHPNIDTPTAIRPNIDTPITIPPTPSISQDSLVRLLRDLLSPPPSDVQAADTSPSYPHLSNTSGYQPRASRSYSRLLFVANAINSWIDDIEINQLSVNEAQHNVRASSESSRDAVQGSHLGNRWDAPNYHPDTPDVLVSTYVYMNPSSDVSSRTIVRHITRIIELFDNSERPDPWSHIARRVSETHALSHQQMCHHLHDLLPTSPTNEETSFYPRTIDDLDASFRRRQ